MLLGLQKEGVAFLFSCFAGFSYPSPVPGTPLSWGAAALRIVVLPEFYWETCSGGGKFTRARASGIFRVFVVTLSLLPCNILGDSGLQSGRWGVFTVTYLSLCCHLSPFALFLFINRLHRLHGLFVVARWGVLICAVVVIVSVAQRRYLLCSYPPSLRSFPLP